MRFQAERSNQGKSRVGSMEGEEQTVDYRSGRQGRESYGVKVPCRQLPDSDG
ncbi:MAG: hypothetical protein WBG24_11060 [Syntrophobacteria bacterium]